MPPLMNPATPAPSSNGTDQSYPPALVRDIQRARQKGFNDRQIAAYIRAELGPGRDSLYMQDPTAFDPSASGNRLLHVLGVAGRSAMNGIENLAHMPGDLVSGAWGLAGKAGLPGGAEMAQFVQQRYGGAPQAANVLGLPEAQTPTGQVLAKGLEGAVSTAPFAAGAGPAAALTTLASGFAGGSAPEIAKQLGAGPTGQAVAAIVASLAVPAIQTGATRALQRLIAGTTEQRQTAQALRDILVAGAGEGNPGTVGQVSESARALENKLRQSSPDAFRKALANQEAGLQQRAQSVLNVGPNDPEAAGQAMELGIKGPPQPGVLGNPNQIQAIVDYQQQVQASQAKIASLVARRDALQAQLQAAAAPQRPSLREAIAAFDDQIAQAQKDASQILRQSMQMFPGVAGIEPRTPAGPRMRAPTVQEQELGAVEDQLGTLRAQTPHPSATPIVSTEPVTQGFIPKFRRTSEALYQKAIGQVPADTPVVPKNLEAWLNGRLSQAAYDPSTLLDLKDPESLNLLQKLQENLANAPNGTPFATLWNMRKALDDEITSFSALSQATSPKMQKTLIQLRSALSKDLEAAVVQQGGKSAAAVWDQAQSYYAKRMEQIEKIYQPLIEKNTPEQIFQAALSGTKRGATILKQSLRPLNPEQKQLVLGSLLNSIMTKATPAGRIVDLDQFVTNWERFTPQTRAVLLQHLGATHANNLTKVVEAVKLINQAKPSLVSIGPPGTSGVAQSGLAKLLKLALPAVGGGGGAAIGKAMGIGSIPMAAGGALFAGGTAAAGSALRTQILIRVLTSPKTTAWLLQTAKIPAGSLVPAAIQLGKMAQSWDDQDKAAAQELSQVITDNLQGPGFYGAPMAAADATAAR